MIDLIDVQVGRMLEALDRTGQADNTLVIFMSDHGEMLGDHGIYFKGAFFYEEAVRVPLIINYPQKFLRDERSTAWVELLDIAPTLLDCAGLDYFPAMQGKSLWSLLTGDSDLQNHRLDVYCENYNASTKHHPDVVYGTMLRTDRHKIVRIHGTNDGELYDLETDPQETHNLWNDSEYANEKIDMLTRLTDRMAWTTDPLPQRDSFGDTFNYLKPT